MLWGRGMVSFDMWIFSCLCSLGLKDCSSPSQLFWNPCQKSIGCIGFYFWTLNSIPFDLCYVYPYASFEIRKCGSSSSVVCFKIVLAIPAQQISPTRCAWSLAFLLPWGRLLKLWLVLQVELKIPFLPFRRHSASRDWAALAELAVVQGKVIKEGQLHLAPQAGGLVHQSSPPSQLPFSSPHLVRIDGWMDHKFAVHFRHTEPPLNFLSFLAL